MVPDHIALRLLEGRTPYDVGHDLQLELVERRKAGTIGDTLVLLEHDPVVTLGRNATDKGLLADERELKSLGIGLRRVERGGEATYHGPGQIVGYPIIDLRARSMGVATYVRRLEEVMIRGATAFGVAAFRHEKLTGVFTDRGKLGAIGVRVTRGVTFHGFAFNAAPDLSQYRVIVPCGMTGMSVTSLAVCAEHAGDEAALFSRARGAIIEAFGAVFGARVSG